MPEMAIGYLEAVGIDVACKGLFLADREGDAADGWFDAEDSLVFIDSNHNQCPQTSYVRTSV